jgi:hypothetical protein
MSTVFCRPFANVIATQEERPTEWSRVVCLKQGDGEINVCDIWKMEVLVFGFHPSNLSMCD